MPESNAAPAIATERARVEIPTGDGVVLVADHIAPAGAGAGAGAVWLGHAILANRRSLDRPAGGGLASEIAAAGLHAYAVDLRGHGESKLPNGGRERGWTYEDLLRDYEAITRFVRGRHAGARVGVVGHGLTGHAVAAWLGTREAAGDAPPPLDAIVTIGANVWLERLEPDPARWRRKRAVMSLMSGFAHVLGRVPAKAFGYGSEDAPGRFIAEFAAWSRTGRWASPGGKDYLAGLARITTPVLAVMGSGDDLLCNPICGELFHRRLTAAPVDLHLSGPGEVGYDPGHMELVTDARSRPLWRRIAGWLAARLGPNAA